MDDAISWGHHSEFGGTWTDRRDAEAELARRLARGALAAELQPALEQWLREGYIVLRGALSDQAVGRAHAALPALRQRLPCRRRGELLASPPRAGVDEPAAATLDPHAPSQEIRDVLLATPIVDWTTIVFDESPLLMDSIVGACSTPAGLAHRDPSLVVVSSPLELVGARIALADGPPFTVWPRSHRLPEHPFSGVSRHYNPERDGVDALREHDERLLADAEEAGLEPVALSLAPGDVVLWSADLLHDDPLDADAAALVAHYCPASREPAWFPTLPHRTRRLSHNGGWLVSRHAELADASADAAPPEPVETPALEVVEAVLERHDESAAPERSPVPTAHSPAPPPETPPPAPATHGRREGGLVGGVRRLLGRRDPH